MGKGFLTGQIKQAEDFEGSFYFTSEYQLHVAYFISEGDHRRNFSRFKKEVLIPISSSFL